VPPPLRSLPPRALRRVVADTIAHYDENARAFWNGTKDHDVQQNVDALLRHAEGPAPLAILDLGCGPGRDLITFKALGHAPIGLEGSKILAAMARKHSGCEVWEQDLLALDLPEGRFAGIFANAVLFHVPSQELLRVLGDLHRTLKPGGVLFCSNPRGPDMEGQDGDRYGCWLRLETWRLFATEAGFTELEHYYRPAGRAIEMQPWLATVWRKGSSG
jgi:SAM-dependent methyltransferase